MTTVAITRIPTMIWVKSWLAMNDLMKTTKFVRARRKKILQIALSI